jgi:hypothetical protein
VHRQKIHPVQYNAGIKVDRVKARWDDQDRELLARLEAEIIATNGHEAPANINQILVGKFRSRTFDAIKSQRKRQEHKSAVLRYLEGWSLRKSSTRPIRASNPMN